MCCLFEVVQSFALLQRTSSSSLSTMSPTKHKMADGNKPQEYGSNEENQANSTTKEFNENSPKYRIFCGKVHITLCGKIIAYMEIIISTVGLITAIVDWMKHRPPKSSPTYRFREINLVITVVNEIAVLICAVLILVAMRQIRPRLLRPFLVCCAVQLVGCLAAIIVCIVGFAKRTLVISSSKTSTNSSMHVYDSDKGYLMFVGDVNHSRKEGEQVGVSVTFLVLLAMALLLLIKSLFIVCEVKKFLQDKLTYLNGLLKQPATGGREQQAMSHYAERKS